jgi:hypothetical protein
VADAADAAQPLEDWDTAGAGPLSGIFAVEVVIQASAVIPVEARLVMRLRLLQRGRELRQKTAFCRLRLPSIEGVAQLIVPPELEAVMAAKSQEATGDYLSVDEAVGADYLPPEATVLLGAELADPEADPLPSEADPAAASDEDGDGSPGVTILVDTLVCDQPESLYIAFRSRLAVSGRVVSVDLMEGEVSPTLELSVLGMSDPCLEAAARLPIEVVPGSTFRAVRVGDAQDTDANGNVDCAEMSAAAADLFGDPWLEAE